MHFVLKIVFSWLFFLLRCFIDVQIMFDLFLCNIWTIPLTRYSHFCQHNLLIEKKSPSHVDLMHSRKKKVFEILIPKKINIVLKFTLKVHVYFSWHISKTFRFQCFSTWFSNAFYNHFHGPLPRSCPVNPVRSAPHLLGFSLHHYPPCCV